MVEGARPSVLIENPILNSPYEEPSRHFRFDDNGITDEVVEGRRPSSYFVPIPAAKKRGGQLALPAEWTADRVEVSENVNRIRERVGRWRAGGWTNVTPTTRRLLQFWTAEDRERKLFFCQVEALETAIYLTEVATKVGDAWIVNQLADDTQRYNPGLPRVAMKMATGSGKTVVMAMVIAWQVLNKAANPQDARFSDKFLVVSPGITIRDRLRVLLPSDPGNYYRERDLVPADLVDQLGRASIVITNFHGFMLRESKAGKVARLTKTVLNPDGANPFLETPDQMARRVCRDLGAGRNQIVVLNDEAHHCYARRGTAGTAVANGHDGFTDETLKGDAKREADHRNEDAMVWVSGLQAVNAKLGIKTVYDLSATPFFLAGSGYPEGKLFPWVVSDFSLTDAIESGIVKIPRVPVSDNAMTPSGAVYRNLWGLIADQLPKKNRRTAAVEEGAGVLRLPAELQGALHSLYDNYTKSFARWSSLAAMSPDAAGTPPVFIVVCNNTAVSKMVFDFVAGFEKPLSYLRDRLVVARDLLTESGSIFVQIGDENVHMVRSLLDEVFGSENFVSLITFKKTGNASAELLAGVVDYLVWYARDARQVKYRTVYSSKPLDGSAGSQYTWLTLPDGTHRKATGEELRATPERAFRPSPMVSQRPPGTFPFSFEGKVFTPAPGYWKTNEDGMGRLARADRLVVQGRTLSYVRYLVDFPVYPFTNFWDDTMTSGFGDPKVYVVQTNTKVIERCTLMTTDPGDLVLDPTCGSGTAAYVAEQWGRRWITCDTSRVALALARTRLMAGKFPHYVLADSPEGAAREADLTCTPVATSSFANDVKQGFVYKRVPHVTLKSIAQNPDIRDGMSREEIDAAIARHADTELLVDKPYEDARRVRVAGPFTMESLSPHRVLDEEQERPSSETETDEAGGFVHTVLANLRKAGVQNTKRDERLTFDWLEPYAGEWLQGEGEYTDADATTKRVAVAVGPEHGTVGPILVREAAKEAVKGQGFDVLVVCGLAFDARVGETAREFGRLVVLPARVNADLMMGDTLKTTGAGNLFMVFGEPDVEIRRDEGKVVVEIHGVDVYDPTTGEVRSSSTDDVACWFVDTDYNGESFFVRHAYFTGADEPYDRLKRALKADIDADTWASLYSTVSRPFDPPSTGKIAVKVINHYGDEVLQVYEVR